MANMSAAPSNDVSTKDVSPPKDLSQTGGLISDVVYNHLDFGFAVVGLSIISLLGIVSNIINIIVFYKQGLKDSVTVTFFCLSMSDFGFSLFALTVAICSIANKIDTNLTVDPVSFQYFFLNPTTFMFYGISTCCSTYLAVERCLCVVVPLKVKGIFSKKVAVITMTAFAIWGLACQVPYYATVDLRWTFDPKHNSTRLMLWQSPNYIYALSFVLIYNSGIQPITAQIVVTTCTLLMIAQLKMSTKFRNVAGTGTVETTSKEAKLIHMVVMVASIFIFCNFPQCVVTAARVAIPEIDVGGLYYNLSNVLYLILYTSMAVNAAVNTFVYYSCSSKYKSILKSICSNAPQAD